MHTRLIRIIAVVFSLISSSALWAASYTLPAALGTASFASCSLSAGSTYNCTAATIALGANTNFIYTLTAGNTTSASQVGVVITDDLNVAGLLFVSCATATGTCSNSSGVVTWAVGCIPVTTSQTATLTVRISSAGGYHQYRYLERRLPSSLGQAYRAGLFTLGGLAYG